MLTPDQISELHRLHWVETWSLRKIARHLHIGREAREEVRVHRAHLKGGAALLAVGVTGIEAGDDPLVEPVVVRVDGCSN